HLLTYPGLRHANVEVQAQGGAVRLSGIVPAAISEDEVKASVAAIPSVERVSINFVSLTDGELGYG
ncbi:MAG TPA: hypothetical protein VFQ89_06300, partial [Candidatus Binatia bacterium]|nr:hypothetical protein [Candidatus Binatia bacterium]